MLSVGCSTDKEIVAQMDLQYRYIYITLMICGASVVGGFVTQQHAPAVIISLFSLCIVLYLVTDLRRYNRGYGQSLSQKRQQQKKLTALLATEINNMIKQCELSLVDINATQTDAVDLISTNFVALQKLIKQQHNIILRHMRESSLEHVQMTRLSEEISHFLNASIRGVQFGDINGQNLQFCLDTLIFIREQIEAIGFEDLDLVIADIRTYLASIQSRRNLASNPVSSSSIDAGEIEFF